MQQRTLLILSAVLAVIFSISIGIFAGFMISKNNAPKNVSSTDNKFQEGWNAAMKALNDSGVVTEAPQGMEIKSVDGIVQSVSGNTINLKVTTPGMMSSKELIVRAVNVDSNTKIMQLVQKDKDQFQKEMDTFNEKMKAYQVQSTSEIKDLPYPPQMQDKKIISIGDIKIGQRISVYSSSDITNNPKFTATEIKVQQASLEFKDLPQLPSAENFTSVGEGSIPSAPPVVDPSKDKLVTPPLTK
jgi:hypothetical protein